MTANACRSCPTALGAIVVAAVMLSPALTAQAPVTPALHTRSQHRLTLRNVMVIYGSARIRNIAAHGADDLKIIAMDRDMLEAIMNEAHKLGPRTARASAARQGNKSTTP